MIEAEGAVVVGVPQLEALPQRLRTNCLCTVICNIVILSLLKHSSQLDCALPTRQSAGQTTQALIPTTTNATHPPTLLLLLLALLSWNVSQQLIT